MKVKNEKMPAKEEPQDEKAGAVDQIKRKYGLASSGVSSHPVHFSILIIISWL